MEARHVAHAVAMQGGEMVGSAGDRAARDPLPELREADPGASARACAVRSGRCGDRNRLRVAPRAAGAARGGAQPAREGAGDRRRPRVRAGADAVRAQLLGKARRAARAVSCHGVADRGLSAARAPVPAGAPRRDRPRRGGRSGVDADRRGRLRHPDVRTHARADGARLLEARPARRRFGDHRRDARPSRSRARAAGG